MQLLVEHVAFQHASVDYVQWPLVLADNRQPLFVICIHFIAQVSQPHVLCRRVKMLEVYVGYVDHALGYSNGEGIRQLEEVDIKLRSALCGYSAHPSHYWGIGGISVGLPERLQSHVSQSPAGDSQYLDGASLRPHRSCSK